MQKRLKILFFVLLLLLGVVSFGQQPKLRWPIGHTSYTDHAQFSPDGKKIVTAARDRGAKIGEVTTRKLLMNLGGHEWPVNYVVNSRQPQGVKHGI